MDNAIIYDEAVVSVIPDVLLLSLRFASVYFYNFGWKDYGVASLTTILDMVKVMSFAIQEGKMAVHCHAGLGRTGGWKRQWWLFQHTALCTAHTCSSMFNI